MKSHGKYASSPTALPCAYAPKQNGDALFVDMTSRARARYSLSLRPAPESSVSHYEQPQVEQVHYVFELRFPGEVLATSGKTLDLILEWGPPYLVGR